MATSFLSYGGDLSNRAGHNKHFWCEASELIYDAPNFCESPHATIVACNISVCNRVRSFHKGRPTALEVLLHHLYACLRVNRLLCRASLVPAGPAQRKEVKAMITHAERRPIIVCKVPWVIRAQLLPRVPAEIVEELRLFARVYGAAAACISLSSAERYRAWL